MCHKHHRTSLEFWGIGRVTRTSALVLESLLSPQATLRCVALGNLTFCTLVGLIIATAVIVVMVIVMVMVMVIVMVMIMVMVMVIVIVMVMVIILLRL